MTEPDNDHRSFVIKGRRHRVVASFGGNLGTFRFDEIKITPLEAVDPDYDDAFLDGYAAPDSGFDHNAPAVQDAMAARAFEWEQAKRAAGHAIPNVNAARMRAIAAANDPTAILEGPDAAAFEDILAAFRVFGAKVAAQFNDFADHFTQVLAATGHHLDDLNALFKPPNRPDYVVVDEPLHAADIPGITGLAPFSIGPALDLADIVAANPAHDIDAARDRIAAAWARSDAYPKPPGPAVDAGLTQRPTRAGVHWLAEERLAMALRQRSTRLGDIGA